VYLLTTITTIARGDDLLGKGKWQNGALATEGVIYCLPSGGVKQILAIDPFKELSMTLKNNFRLYPQELGRLFVKDEKCDETFYDSAVRKFGIEKVFQLIEECPPPPWMKNGLILIARTPFHYSWLQLRVRIVHQCL
jgi:hypothetical protein